MKTGLLFILFITLHSVTYAQSESTCTHDILNEKLTSILGNIDNYETNIKKYKTALCKIESLKKSADSLQTIVENSGLSAEEQHTFQELISLTVNNIPNDVTTKARTLDSKHIMPFNNLIPLASLYGLDKTFAIANTTISESQKWAADVCKFATNKDINYYNSAKVKEQDTVFEVEIKEYHLKKDDVIADIGTGSAYFIKALAKYTDHLTVYANEINAATVSKLETKLALLDFYDNKNIAYQAILGDTKSANLPKGKFDKIIIRNTFHHFSYPNEMLQDLKKSLKKGGKLYIVDIMKDEAVKTPACPNHITKDAQLKSMTDNGFVLVRTTPLKYDEFQMQEFAIK